MPAHGVFDSSELLQPDGSSTDWATQSSKVVYSHAHSKRKNKASSNAVERRFGRKGMNFVHVVTMPHSFSQLVCLSGFQLSARGAILFRRTWSSVGSQDASRSRTTWRSSGNTCCEERTWSPRTGAGGHQVRKHFFNALCTVQDLC